MYTTILDEQTQDGITVTKQADGSKNTTFIISGTITKEEDSKYNIIDLESLTGNPSSLRLDSGAFVIESGLKCILSYNDKPYIIPLEGRGKLEFDSFGGVPGHDIDLTLEGTGRFFLILDISKLGV